jgi:tellurite resistance protein TehA-like permease
MMRIIKWILPALVAVTGITLSARALANELLLWALILLIFSILLLLFTLLRPLFIRRGRRGSGLPSRYERLPDPWRTLDKGKDPTIQ